MTNMSPSSAKRMSRQELLEEMDRVHNCGGGRVCRALEASFEQVGNAAVDARRRGVALAGPWLGEFGVEAAKWIPHLHHLREEEKMEPMVGSYWARGALYRDVASFFLGLPDGLHGEFIEEESSHNEGVLHGAFGFNGAQVHARRKRFRDKTYLNGAITAHWVKAVCDRIEADELFVVQRLGSARTAYMPVPSKGASEKVQAWVRAAGGPGSVLLLMLPRSRAYQSDARGWEPWLYHEVIERLLEHPNVMLGLLGTRAYEGEFEGITHWRLFNSVAESLDVQLALWHHASCATGPPCGGLSLGYVVGTPIVHWYKSSQPPRRKGEPWWEIAETEYSALRGVVSSWCAVDSRTDLESLVRSVLKAAGA